jgi:hypothetical protein
MTTRRGEPSGDTTQTTRPLGQTFRQLLDLLQSREGFFVHHLTVAPLDCLTPTGQTQCTKACLKSLFSIIEDWTKGIFPGSALIKATGRPNDARAELAHDRIHSPARWLPLFLDVFGADPAFVKQSGHNVCFGGEFLRMHSEETHPLRAVERGK